MARSIRRLGLIGATLALLFIAGLNFTALNNQWDVPFMGVEEANAWGRCVAGVCVMEIPGLPLPIAKPGCWKIDVYVVSPCASSCRSCW